VTPDRRGRPDALAAPDRLDRRDALAAPDPMQVFGDVRARDVRSLASPVLKIVVAAGTCLVSEDDEVGTFFVIRAGTAELSRDGMPVSTLGPGDCFGESDPRAAQPQLFTVTARTELTLLTFSAEGIARLCAVIPGARERIRRYLPAPIYVLPPPERSRSAAASSTVMAR
jgi:CRP-like cAMP-binding protein